uniref:Large ribosomal subunit protein uL3c n=1 Tax=Bangiopsis subsimplex TaxID=139980 RepID=A0A1C9CD15_9RHOD|nr:ribosomal protein L3 [Bangiopsis subsimplex]AOM66276.1 ribosomal protein L3 [Bangiopsis subsimplex]ARO90362.1 50S ribosomal protein L3 [Bangiopsis subsimplex]
MQLGILGKKVGMTQIFDTSGLAIPVTIIKAGPCLITQVQNTKTYRAIQLGFGEVADKHLTKPQLGHLKRTNSPPLKYLKEFKVDKIDSYSVGDIITVNNFQIGQLLQISGNSIGKGFAGYQKRHNFARGPMSHGSKNHREPGSIGAGTTPGRVYPGKKMAGHLGSKKTTVRNLELIHIDEQEHLLIIKGSVPGKAGNLLSIKSK